MNYISLSLLAIIAIAFLAALRHYLKHGGPKSCGKCCDGKCCDGNCGGNCSHCR